MIIHQDWRGQIRIFEEPQSRFNDRVLACRLARLIEWIAVFERDKQCPRRTHLLRDFAQELKRYG